MVAGNGYSLDKTHNAVLDALGCSLRASQKAVIHVVALFVKGVTIHCKVRLVANRCLTRCIHQYNIVGVLGILSQDQFAFEQYSVIDAVIMGDRELWEIKCERERIYGLPEMSEADGMKVGHLESEFAEMDGYTAESRAGEILLNAGIEESLHFGLMSEVAPGRKLRVLLAQALFANPDMHRTLHSNLRCWYV